MSNLIQFKTSMKCVGCVAAITPELDALKEVKSWKADVSGADKTLVVDADETVIPKVMSVLEKAGFKAELVHVN